VEASKRRAYLEDLAETAESDATRLRALDLLDRLDERERETATPSADELTEAAAEELADDAGRLERLAQLYLDSGLLTPIVEERARELAVEMTRERFAVVEGQGAPQGLGDASEPPVALPEPEQVNDRADVSGPPREPEGASSRVLRDPWPDDVSADETVMGRVRRMRRGNKPDTFTA
jgi:hypothetical protein